MNLTADLGKSLPPPPTPRLPLANLAGKEVGQGCTGFHSVPLGPFTSLDDTKSPSRCS